MRIRQCTWFFAALASITLSSPTPLANADELPHIAGPTVDGINITPCESDQRPVVLVHGTFENIATSWADVATDLTASGRCVYALNYGRDTTSIIGSQPGIYGTGDMTKSAAELADFVEQVLTHTHFTQVDMIAHSQGGIVARQYLRFNGGTNPTNPQTNKVATLVQLATANHGARYLGLMQAARTAANLGIDALTPATPVAGVGPIQQIIGSEFLNRLNSGGDTDPGIHYVVLATAIDIVTTPDAAFLTQGAGATVDNILIQDGCPSNTTDHYGTLHNPRPLRLIRQALDQAHIDARSAPC